MIPNGALCTLWRGDPRESDAALLLLFYGVNGTAIVTVPDPVQAGAYYVGVEDGTTVKPVEVASSDPGPQAPANPGNSGNDDSDNDSGSNADVGAPSTGGGSTTVGMTTNSTTSGTTASASVKTSDMNKAIDSAVTEAARQGTSPVVEIEVKTSPRADSLNVDLPVSSLKKLDQAEDASLVITSDVAEVRLDSAALSALVDQASTGSTVTLQVAPVAASTLTPAQREIVGSSPVVDLSLISHGMEIHDYGAGVITVTLPYELAPGQSANDVVVYYLESDGTLTPCRTSYADGKVTFTTTHLSQYVIGDGDLAGQQTGATAFTDVPPGEYYYDAVLWAVEKGIVYGITDDTFGPDVTCTRAQIVSFLWRQAGSPTMSGTTPLRTCPPALITQMRSSGP